MDLSYELINWYQTNKRNLPWRNTTDAYTIWLSEIILQQTRVEQGLPYFYKFIEHYPDVNAFAAAHEDEVLKLWQGLGYYSRGRNMLKTALFIREHHKGIFPQRYDDLIKLKGIGEYTAAAISSFSVNEARAVVDGNVYRVLARFFGISEAINSPAGKRTFQALADEILSQEHPGLHNQAMMEFGAMLCKPKAPLCGDCPVRQGCYAFLNKQVDSLPVKLKTVKVRERFLNYFLITDGDKILMNKRDESGIWANMYDLPLIETNQLLPLDELVALPETQSFFGPDMKIENVQPIVKHVLTHQRLFVRFITLSSAPIKMETGWSYIERNNFKKIALPKVIFIFLDNFLN